MEDSYTFIFTLFWIVIKVKASAFYELALRKEDKRQKQIRVRLPFQLFLMFYELFWTKWFQLETENSLLKYFRLRLWQFRKRYTESGSWSELACAKFPVWWVTMQRYVSLKIPPYPSSNTLTNSWWHLVKQMDPPSVPSRALAQFHGVLKTPAPIELEAVEDTQHSIALGPSGACCCYHQHCWYRRTQSGVDGSWCLSCLISIIVFCIPIHWAQLCKSAESHGFIPEATQMELVCTVVLEGIIWTLFSVVICKKKKLNLALWSKPQRDGDVSHGTWAVLYQ